AAFGDARRAAVKAQDHRQARGAALQRAELPDDRHPATRPPKRDRPRSDPPNRPDPPTKPAECPARARLERGAVHAAPHSATTETRVIRPAPNQITIAVARSSARVIQRTRNVRGETKRGSSARPLPRACRRTASGRKIGRLSSLTGLTTVIAVRPRPPGRPAT